MIVLKDEKKKKKAGTPSQLKTEKKINEKWKPWEKKLFGGMAKAEKEKKNSEQKRGSFGPRWQPADKSSPECHLTAASVLRVFPAVLLPLGFASILNNLRIQSLRSDPNVEHQALQDTSFDKVIN
ncbi:hypothetical protein DM01DRAFT_1112817 [Hesseltinella vesiculosa]|uniref:Uncharacterized protein n=1 Tax=Hesseltinella vesiculosa TaxID=101127 RepID=A0A1X2GA19_9FUNG|nr:hypothetical protein DM01DRAFT_1112817 [Hesseltinella vesiculosa]